MANYASGSIYFSGLGSGTDFSDVVAKLKQVEEIPKTQLQNWQADWQKRYDAFGEIISSVREAKNALAGLNSPSKFLKKIATSADEKILKATATANAVDGDHTINVQQLASNAIWAFTGHYDSKDAVLNTTGTDQTFSYSYKGTRRDIKVPKNTTLEGLINQVNNDPQNPGVRMSLIHDGDGYTFQIQGKDSGKDATLSVFPTSGLVGFAGETSTWTSKAVSNPSAAFDPNASSQKEYNYTVIMAGGGTVSVPPIKGNQSLQDLADAINAAVGGTNDVASVNGNKLTLSGNAIGLQYSVTDPADPSGASKIYDVSGMAATMTNKYAVTGSFQGTDAIGTAGTPVSFDLKLRDGTTKTISVDGGTTWDELKTKVYADAKVNLYYDTDSSGNITGVNLKNASFDGALPSGISSAAPTATWGSSSKPTTTSALSAGFDPSDVFASTARQFTVTLADGTTKTATVDAGATWNDLATALKTVGVTLKFNKDSTGAYTTLSMQGATDLTVKNETTGNQDPVLNAPTTTWSSTSAFSKAATIDPQAIPAQLTYEVVDKDGNSTSVTVNSSESMLDVVDKLKLQGLSIKWMEEKTDTTPNPKEITWNSATNSWDYADGSGPYTGKACIQMENVKQVSGHNLEGSISDSSLWAIQDSQNAIFTVDNWPRPIESSSNTVTDVIDGVTLTLVATGNTRISVAADTNSVKENIQSVLDAINTVLSKVQELTKWDENKTQASYDKDDDNYSSSQWDQEKGSVLTGNYGVQLLNSRLKSLVSTPPPGFKNIQGSDLLSGDYLAALSQMGIKTCTEEGNPNYGLLMIAPPSGNDEMQALDQKRFDDAISKHLDDVINLFAADSQGSTTSSDFRYANHIKGTTKAGAYNVSYTVNDAGDITDVFINGVRANGDSTMGAGWYTADPGAGGAAGLSIQIDNYTPGTHSGTISVKQGKIGEMEDFFTDELRYNKYTPESNGALMILQANYQSIMDNIQTKIDRETERISTWERREKAKFARLETLLGQYNQQQTALVSQLNQLSSSSS